MHNDTVDISSLLSTEPATTPDDLMKELEQSDPMASLIIDQLLQMGNTIVELQDRLANAELMIHTLMVREAERVKAETESNDTKAE